ncbi:hypothetical protein D3C77_606600 [compost metagenome]
MRSCQSSRNSASGCGSKRLAWKNRSRASLACSRMEKFRLMQISASGVPLSSSITLLIERIFWPVQLSFS